MTNEKVREIMNKYDNNKNNKILNEILEKKFYSHFVLCNEDKIVHASHKYKKYIGDELTKEISEIVRRENSSGLKHYFQVSDKCEVKGALFYRTFTINEKKGLIIVKYNKRKFKSENIELLSDLCSYINL